MAGNIMASPRGWSCGLKLDVNWLLNAGQVFDLEELTFLKVEQARDNVAWENLDFGV
jgi:hypothetical protein